MARSKSRARDKTGPAGHHIVDPAAPIRPSLPAALRRRQTLARWVLFWERLWPALWPPLGIAGGFIAVALFDVLPTLPAAAHAAVLVAFGVAFTVALWRGLVPLRFPGLDEARRRLEVASGLAHRPLSVLDDDLVVGTGDAAGESLWRAHVARARAVIGRLRVGVPRAGLTGHDPLALRALVVLALVVGGTLAGSNAFARLDRAVAPDLAGLSKIPPASFQLWVTPPQHTALAPLFFEAAPPSDAAAAAAGAAAPITVPAGSVILAQVHDGRGAPRLSLADAVHPLAPVDDRSWRLELPVAADAAFEARVTLDQDGKVLAAWQFVFVPDQPPTAAFGEPPAATPRAALRLAYSVADDYGVADAGARIERAGAVVGDVISLDLPLPASGPRAADAVSFHDLTAHPWAGLPVTIRLTVRDTGGQVGASDGLEITLPERAFNHPVAREIVAQRKRLSVEPQARLPVAQEVHGIAVQPQRYGEDTAVFLALTVARSRLVHSLDADVVEQVQALLWDTALHVEDGGLSLAERQLRELQERLQEALAEGAEDAEIEQLIEELRAALDEYLNALAENLQRQLEQGLIPQLGQIDPNSVTDRQDLERLLDQARDLARMGAREAAQEMLSQLQEMLESLQAMPQFGQMPQGNQEAMQMMDDLQDIIQGQQELLDRSFQQAQEGEPPPDGGSADAAQQDALRRQLGELMRQLGEMTGDIPGAMGRAEQAMRRAGEALAEGQPGDAVGPQGEALDQLRQGGQAMAEALSQNPGPGQAGLQPGQPGPQGQGRDPLGRRLDGNRGLDTGAVQIPDQADVQRARQILDELRRRAGDRQRPDFEIDYIERLLRRF